MTPEIFNALVRILRGRGFDDRDHAGRAPVAVLSEFTARQMFGSGDAVGRPVIVGNRASSQSRVTIIGVAQDTDVRRMLGEPAPFLYRPLSQHPGTFLTVVARSSDSTSAVRPLTSVFRRADADLPAEVIGSGRSVLAGPFEVARSAGQAAVALGALTLVLAMVGLGIQSHVVGQRTREIGVHVVRGNRSSN